MSSLPVLPPRPARLTRPEWLKVRLSASEDFAEVNAMIRGLKLVTVCEEARCPNIHECWARERTATFMLLGDVCTRHCGFCAVGKGKPGAVDPDEPRRVGEAVARLGLKHAVVTSVNRDDLPDGGAEQFARTIREIRRQNAGCAVEVLIPDFRGDWRALQVVLEENPEVLNHNIETVPRLYRRVRPDAIYDRSLKLIARAKASRKPGNRLLRTKSGLMAGLGETSEEILSTLADLRAHGCDIATVGQYLQPYEKRLPVEKYYTPDEFGQIRSAALALGFSHVESGPLVRSSYHARRAIS
ncbi:MAG: lipoyl synthase [Thermoanaerobaculia bacterium]